jgi:hypothetical protein
MQHHGTIAMNRPRCPAVIHLSSPRLPQAHLNQHALITNAITAAIILISATSTPMPGRLLAAPRRACLKHVPAQIAPAVGIHAPTHDLVQRAASLEHPQPTAISPAAPTAILTYSPPPRQTRTPSPLRRARGRRIRMQPNANILAGRRRWLHAMRPWDASHNAMLL